MELPMRMLVAGRRTPSSRVYTGALDIVARGPFARKKLS
jgi:hypothetical protein